MFDMNQMQQIVFGMFAQQREKWPLELKQAMSQFSVKVIQDPDRISIVCESDVGAEDNPNVEKAKKILLDSLMGPLPQIVGSFGCQTKVFK